MSVQAWPVRADIVILVEIGAGFGAYVFVHTKRQPIPEQITNAVAPVVSSMASRPFAGGWFVRAICHRVVSSYRPDAEIWRLGFGHSL